MNGQLDPLARLMTAAEAIEKLRDFFASDAPMDAVAAQVANTAVDAIPHADAVSITALVWPDPRTIAATNEQARELDSRQYASGRGPCLEAALQRAPVRIVVDNRDERWPEFSEAAKRVGIGASLSMPLLIVGTDDKQETLGSLNIYSQSASAFDPFDEELMRVYTVAAGQAIGDANRWHQSRETVGQLENALTSRSDIDMAKGAIIALHGCDADQAFALLVRESQTRNVKVRDIAVEVLEKAKVAQQKR